jgi:hypothetical protein
MPKMIFELFVAALSLSAVSTASFAQQQINISGASGCDLLLQPTEIESSDDLSYAYNLVSTTSDNDKKLSIFGSISDTYTGDFKLDSNQRQFAQSTTNNISYNEHHDFATKFLSDNQIKGYVKCLESAQGGMAAVIRDFDDDQVRVEITYRPTDTAQLPIPLRESVSVSGVTNFELTSLPEKLMPWQNPLAISFHRDGGKPFKFEVNKNVSKTISLVVPVLPKFPCIALDKEGHCTTILQQAKYSGIRVGDGGHFTDDILPVDWDWSLAAIAVAGNAWFDKSAGGAAGAATLVPFALNTDGSTFVPPASSGRLLFGTAIGKNGPDPFSVAFQVPRSKSDLRKVGLLARLIHESA